MSNPVRVLLIDDDQDDYVLTRDLFADIPGDRYRLDWVSDYQTALDTVCRKEHDVYLVDYRLGSRTGLDLLADVAARSKSGPFILLTGQSMFEIDMAAMEQGAADYLEKARLDPTLLERSIRYALQQSRQEAELERKVRERTEELATANARLRHEDKMKDEFLATLAHELRNPLAPIRNALEIMRMTPGATAFEPARQIIDRQVRQLVRLIDDLLDVSRITRGKLSLVMESLDLREVITTAAEASKPVLDKAQVAYSASLPDERLPVAADRVRLAQVFTNLLNNAAKYTEPGGRVELAADRQKGLLRVRVADTGVGIPAAVLPQVFELFTQVDRTLNRAQGGLGIGLALVKKLTEMHGGTVEAASAGEGKGATFTVWLPVSEPGA
jgi:signal transduction histidine kinase